MGWHRYNEPQKQDEEETPPPVTVPLTSLPPTADEGPSANDGGAAEYRHSHPTVENLYDHEEMQNFWTSQASRFRMPWYAIPC